MKKTYIHSPSFKQHLNWKLIECFSTYIPINKIPNFLNEEETDLKIEELVKHEDFQKLHTEIETHESKEELNYPPENDSNQPNMIKIDDFCEKEINDPRVQALFKRSRHNNISLMNLSQNYYELPKKIDRANGITYFILKPNNFRDVQNLYQDEQIWIWHLMISNT